MTTRGAHPRAVQPGLGVGSAGSQNRARHRLAGAGTGMGTSPRTAALIPIRDFTTRIHISGSSSVARPPRNPRTSLLRVTVQPPAAEAARTQGSEQRDVSPCSRLQLRRHRRRAANRGSSRPTRLTALPLTAALRGSTPVPTRTQG